MANSVGIDLHRKRSHIAALDEHGVELFSRRIKNDPDTFVALLGELDGESKIALEATYGWEGLAELLEDHGYELHLAHPLRTKAIASARVKTDAVDARTLAHLLRADEPPAATRGGGCPVAVGRVPSRGGGGAPQPTGASGPQPSTSETSASAVSGSSRSLSTRWSERVCSR